ncbi:hypothetical protein ACE6H2_013160 [Prunus campanulata]
MNLKCFNKQHHLGLKLKKERQMAELKSVIILNKHITDEHPILNISNVRFFTLTTTTPTKISSNAFIIIQCLI